MPEVPGAVVVKFATNLPLRRSYMGFSMIGTGSTFQSQIENDPGLIGFLKFGGAGNDALNVAHRALFFAEVLAVTAGETDNNDIGGLFQVHLVLPGGVYPLPYQRWINLGAGMGTWVNMEINSNDQWVQVHEPTGLRIPLASPYVLPDRDVQSIFDMKEYLDRSSPGVIPESNPQKIYQLPEQGLRMPRM